MEQENKKQIEEKKPITKKISSENKDSSSSEKSKLIKDINKKQDKKDISKKKEKKKRIEEKKPKKTEAVVNARNLSVSTKHSVAICNYIRGKGIDRAILMLEQVEKFKKPIPMKGEIPHKRGRIMSGRYPIKAVQEFIKLLKSLKANAIVNELEFEKYVVFCKANIAPRPYKRFGRARFKRTHVTLKLILPKKKIRRGVKR